MIIRKLVGYVEKKRAEKEREQWLQYQQEQTRLAKEKKEAEKQASQARQQAEEAARRREVEAGRAKAEQERQELRQRYRSSELVQQVLRELCFGNVPPEIIIGTGRLLPKQIRIDSDKIEALVNGNTRTFDFAQNRVENFETREVENFSENTLRPMVILGEVLNEKLGNQYVVRDTGWCDLPRDEDGYSNNGVYCYLREDQKEKIVRYQPECVYLELKPTKFF